MDWEIIVLTLLIIGLSVVANHFHWKFISQEISQSLARTKKANEKKDVDHDVSSETSKEEQETGNHVLNYLNSLGEDKFPSVIEINLDKVDFEEIGEVLKQTTKESINAMGPRKGYVLFVKMLRYEATYFDKTYSLEKYYKGNTFEYKIKNKETDLNSMRTSLLSIIEDLREFTDKTKKEVMGRAMGIFSELISSPEMSGLFGLQGSVINLGNNIKIEEVQELPALTEKEKDILDEINQLDNNTLTAADDPIESEKNELEKTLEDAGHL